MPKLKGQLTKQITLSDASRIERIDTDRIKRECIVHGMDKMYQIVIKACDRVNGIGPKRSQALKEAILDQIIEYGKAEGIHT